MLNPNLSQKTVDLLRLASIPAGQELRRIEYQKLVALYGQKPVDRKMAELARRGYIEFGVSAVVGWLTKKGEEFLASLEPPAPRDPSSQPYPDGFGNHRVL